MLLPIQQEEEQEQLGLIASYLRMHSPCQQAGLQHVAWGVTGRGREGGISL